MSLSARTPRQSLWKWQQWVLVAACLSKSMIFSSFLLLSQRTCAIFTKIGVCRSKMQLRGILNPQSQCGERIQKTHTDTFITVIEAFS
jgi:hypothetical protein